MLIDTHAHLDFPEFDRDRDEVVQRAQEAGIGYIINIGSSLGGSRASLELSRRYGHIYAAIGIHPHEAEGFGAKEELAVRELAKEKKVVAIGEIGLDYYRHNSKKEAQEALFVSLIKVAKGLSLPLVIHCRLAEPDILRILKAAMPVEAVVHCFSGSRDFLEECLNLGFYISFTCNITYKKSQNLKEIIKAAPLERIFLETDAPYLAPEGLRGKRNEPLNTRYVAEEIARIKGIGVEEVAQVTTEGAKKFFRLE